MLKSITLVSAGLLVTSAHAATFTGDLEVEGKRVKIELSKGSGEYEVLGTKGCSDEKARQVTKIEQKASKLFVEHTSETCVALLKVKMPVEKTLRASLGQGFLTSHDATPSLNFSAGSGEVSLHATEKSQSKVKVSLGAGSVSINQAAEEAFSGLNVSIGSGDINYVYPKGQKVESIGGVFNALKNVTFDGYKAVLSVGFGNINLIEK